MAKDKELERQDAIPDENKQQSETVKTSEPEQSYTAPGATISKKEYYALLDKSNDRKANDNDFKLIGENMGYYNGRTPGPETLKNVERVMGVNQEQPAKPTEPTEPIELREEPEYNTPDKLNLTMKKELSQASNVVNSLNKQQSKNLKIIYDKAIKDLNDYYSKQHTNESIYSTTILDSLRNGEFGSYDYKAEKTAKEMFNNNKEITKLTDAINDKSGNKLRKRYSNEITPDVVEQEKNRIRHEILSLEKQIKSTNDKKDTNKLNKQINELSKLVKDDNAIKQGLYLNLANRDLAELDNKRKSLRAELRDNWRNPDERNARNKAGYFIANSLGTALQNIGKSLQGKDTKSESEFSKIRGENIKSAINRRNKRFDTLLDEEIQINHLNTEEAKEFKDIMTSIKKIVPSINQTAINEAAKIYGDLKGSQLFKTFSKSENKDDVEVAKLYMLLKLAEQSGAVGDISKLAMSMGLDTLVPNINKNNNNNKSDKPLRDPKK